MTFSRISVVSLVAILVCLQNVPIICNGQDTPWYKHGQPRIYHPNMKKMEAENFDVKRFVEDCKDLEAEAIVFSAGGIWAFYPSAVRHHEVSPLVMGRDLLGEVVDEAHLQGMKVIARLDFSAARPEVHREHPEWFYVDKDGQLKEKHAGDTELFRTTPTGAYQNEAFAHKVLHELFSNYNVDGVHLNASGFSGISFDPGSIEQYGGAIPRQGEASEDMLEHFYQWREKKVASQLRKYREIIHSYNPNALFMGEISGAESQSWAFNHAFDNVLMSGSFTNLLLTTGRMESRHPFRLWPGLSAELAHAAGADGAPVINLKIQMRGLGYSEFLKPPAEYQYYAYQSIAHGAGIKAPTFGIPATQKDPRTPDILHGIYAFMKYRSQYAREAEPIKEIALIWPESAIEKRYISTRTYDMNPRHEFVGLYQGLIQSHVQTAVLYDTRLQHYDLKGYSGIIVPGGTTLESDHWQLLLKYCHSGGMLLVTDIPEDEDSFGDISPDFQKAFGGQWSNLEGEGNYILPTDRIMELENAPKGPIGLTARASGTNYRKVTPPAEATHWMVASEINMYYAIPEEIPLLSPGAQPVLMSRPYGDGSILYFAGCLGTLVWHTGHSDYIDLLNTMVRLSPEEALFQTNAPSSVELSAKRIPKGLLIALVNGTGSVPLQSVVPVYNIELSVKSAKYRKAYLVVPGEDAVDLDMQFIEGRSVVHLDRIGPYAEVLLSGSDVPLD